MYSMRLVSLLRIPVNRGYPYSLIQKRFIKLEPTQALVNLEASETFEQKNERLRRPLSPHLTIYQPQLTTILSITHRATGVILVGYILGFGFLNRFGYVEELVNFVNSLGLAESTIIGVKVVFLFPFMYHLFNGIRHLVWDAGFGISIRNVYRTGYIVLLLTLIASTTVAFL